MSYKWKLEITEIKIYPQLTFSGNNGCWLVWDEYQLLAVSAVVGPAAVPAAAHKVGGWEAASAEEGDESVHWLEQDAARMVQFHCIVAAY